MQLEQQARIKRMKKLALFGAGDLGSEVLELLYQCRRSTSFAYDEVFFVDDSSSAIAPDGLRLLNFEGVVSEAATHDVSAIVCIGEPLKRREVAERLTKAGISLATLVHPSVEIPESARLGSGCIVYRDSYIGPNTSIGENTLIIRDFIAHNCRIGANCVFNANVTLACHVNVGDQSFLSIGSMVKEGVSIGERVIVGVGAAVFLDVEDDLYVVGNPARPMRRNEDQIVFRG